MDRCAEKWDVVVVSDQSGVSTVNASFESEPAARAYILDEWDGSLKTEYDDGGSEWDTPLGPTFIEKSAQQEACVGHAQQAATTRVPKQLGFAIDEAKKLMMEKYDGTTNKTKITQITDEILTDPGEANRKVLEDEFLDLIVSVYKQNKQANRKGFSTQHKTAGMVRLDDGQFGWDFLLVDVDTGKDILIQTDWEYPAIASDLGWVACEHGDTDGTVDCEHRTATEMIEEAGNFLRDHIGETFEDPGYFAEDDHVTAGKQVSAANDWLPDFSSPSVKQIANRVATEIKWEISDAEALAVLILEQCNAHKEAKAVNDLLAGMPPPAEGDV